MQVSLDYQVSLESLDHSCLSRGECRRFGLPRCATCAIELHEGLETLAPLQPPSRIRRENPAAGIAKKELSRGEASDSGSQGSSKRVERLAHGAGTSMVGGNRKSSA